MVIVGLVVLLIIMPGVVLLFLLIETRHPLLELMPALHWSFDLRLLELSLLTSFALLSTTSHLLAFFLVWLVRLTRRILGRIFFLLFDSLAPFLLLILLVILVLLVWVRLLGCGLLMLLAHDLIEAAVAPLFFFLFCHCVQLLFNAYLV